MMGPDTSHELTTPHPDPVTNREELGAKLKLELNQLLWTYAPGSLTLDKADTIAAECLDMILEGKTYSDMGGI